MLLLWLATGVLTGHGGVTPPPPAAIISGGAGNYNFLNRRKYKEDEVEDSPKPATLEIVKIGKAPHETITGLVIPKSKALRATGRDRLQEIEKSRFDAKQARADHLRAIQLADDDWMLLN